MADNSVLPATGETIADDGSITTGVANGAKVQRMKAGWGAAGSYTDPAIATPLPVQMTMETSQMSNLGAIVNNLYAAVNVSSSGSNPIVAAAGSGKVIRVLAYVLVCDAAVAVSWLQGVTAVSGTMSFAANGGISCAFNPFGWFQTAANAALNLNLGAAIGVRGHINYVVL